MFRVRGISLCDTRKKRLRKQQVYSAILSLTGKIDILIILRGTYHLDKLTFPIIGLIAHLCSFEIGVEEESRGAIKSLYK